MYLVVTAVIWIAGSFLFDLNSKRKSGRGGGAPTNYLLNCENDSRTTVGKATLELSILVSDSLAGGVLPVLILCKLCCGWIRDHVFGSQYFTHLLAFKPECGGPGFAIKFLRSSYFLKENLLLVTRFLQIILACDVKFWETRAGGKGSQLTAVGWTAHLEQRVLCVWYRISCLSFI